jgi:hypothetical protein
VNTTVTPQSTPLPEALLRAGLTLCSVYYLIVFCLLGWARLLFPGALEWVEGSMYCHVARLLAGQALYVEPSPEFVPSIYPPLYFYAAAALSSLTGPGFATLRLISLLSALGSMALIALLVSRETSSRIAGLWAAGLFAATYHASATYLDIGRIDTLFLFLVLGSVAAIRFAAGMPGCLLAAGLLVCAALTKQTALVLSLPLVLYACMARPRLQALVFVGVLAAGIALMTALLNAASSGWYVLYVFTLPGRHPILWERLGPFWLEQLRTCAVAGALTVTWFFLAPTRQNRPRTILYGLLCTALIAVACMAWIKIGGFKNVLISAHAALALGTGLALGSAHHHLMRIVFYAAALMQFAVLWYNPLPLVPGDDHARILHRSVAAVQSIEGEVYAPTAGYLTMMAGKQNSAHLGCINDVLYGDSGPVRDRLIADINEAIRSHEYTAILLDRPFGAFQHEVDAHYMLCPDYAEHPLYWPLIRYWYVPRKVSP